jgi:hypothetical protein
MAEKQVGDYEFEDKGINTASYFGGAGTAFTRWDECFTGVGDTPAQAADDAIEMAAQSGYATEQITYDAADFPDEAEDGSDLHFEDCPHGTMAYAEHDEDCLYIESGDLDKCTCECDCEGEAPQYYVVLYIQERIDTLAA